ncbi:phosphate ABC transporter substrate-binding protein [Aestuariibacter halophilus]|uniref:Phosphate ABC transporter substrate-binding protein n=1 Tax=Fluctibacter halophilus TaxID=226011 RepID=A0ABS8G7A5_9ALTE|nr:phosphate ABC transporter substrate-binding protein [Aestuariibacter halophilus]MCC2616403.1 phosphate ABC transporter substrate-binding protein [Aestuariibacter halophilus]
MKHYLTGAVAGSLLLFSQTVLAEIVMVVHPSNGADLSQTQVQRLFLGKEKKFSDGSAATPINLTNGHPLRESFDTEVIGRSSNQVAAYWSKLVFTGKGVPPKEMDSPAAVIAAVAADASAVGYVDAADVTGDVKAISIN